jgi:DNA topoisomerase-1
MVFKNGKFGKFYACSDYPNCKTTEAFSTGVKCPECDVGEIVEKQSRFKRVFYSCGTWPKCNFSMWDKPVMKPCPECKFPLMSDKTTKRQGHIYKCVKKECGYFELVDDENSKVTELDKNEKLA